MREVPASEAKTHLRKLLDEVERGESIVITRRGRRIARIVPDVERRQKEVEEVEAEIADLKALGKEIRRKHGPISVEEILAWRHEGHKY
jgi:prevent-host-death family protein